jgi:hypothetical protein
MSILPSGVFAFGCDLFGFGMPPGAVCAGGLVSTKTKAKLQAFQLLKAFGWNRND